MPHDVREQITLGEAIAACKALEAAAIKYRNMAAEPTTGSTTRRILIDRAVDCEKVARNLVSGASVE